MKKAVNAVTFISLALAASVTYNIVQHQRAKGIRPGASSAPPASSELGAPGDPTTPIVEPALKNNGSRFDSAANTPARISGDITFKSASYDRNDEELTIDFSVPESRSLGRVTNSSLELTPSVPGMHVYTHGSRIVVGGRFEPTTEYRVRVKKGLLASSGQATLANDAVFDFKTPDLEERMSFLSSGEIYPVSYGRVELPFSSQNVKKFHAELYRAYENNLGIQSILWDTDYMSLVAEKDLTLSDAKNKRVNHMLDVTSLLADPKDFTPGYYKLVVNYSRASSWGGTYEETISRSFLLSDLTVVAMGGEETAPGSSPLTLAVRRISDNSPVAGARCEFLSRKNQVLATGETDANGLVTAQLNTLGRDPKYPDGPYAVTVRTGKTESDQEFAWFPLEIGVNEAETAPNAFVFAERGILRPGETFQASAFIRERAKEPGSNRALIYGKPLKNAPVKLTVFSPDGKQFFSKDVTTDAAGFVSAPVAVPDTAVSGMYSIHFGLGDAVWGESWIRVGSYVPDRIRAKLEHGPLPAGSDALKQPISAILSADYYFGTPVPEANARLYLDCSPDGKRPDHWDGWEVGDASAFNYDDFEAAGTVANGKEEFTLPSFQSRGSSFDPVRVGIQASVQEPGGRSVTGTDVFTLYPSSWFIGLKQKEDAGKACMIDVALLTPEKGRSAELGDGREISFTVFSRKWDYVLVDEQDGYRRRWRETVSEVAGAAKTLAIPAGADLSAFTSKIEFDLPSGCYDIVAEYGAGIRTKLQVWHSAGESGRRSGDPSELVFKTDGTKKPGETAQIKFNAPVAGELFCIGSFAPAGFTQKVAAGENTVSVKIPADYQAGEYHAVMALVGRQGDEYVLSRGLATIPVDHTAEHKLNVTLTVPGIVRPESEAEVTISLASPDGAPSAGQVCLFAVDEGVLALTGFKTPDIYRHFYQAGIPAPSLYEAYSTLFPKLKLRPDGTIGGGDGPSAQAAMKASNLKMKDAVRLIAPPVKVPASGSATLKVNIPDHSGSLRFMAVASADDRAGSGSREIIVRTPVSLTVSAPRVLAPGDEAVLTVRAFNHDAKNGAVKFTLALPDSLELVGNAPVLSALAPGETKDLSVRVKALDKTGEGTIAATLAVGAEARTESLPVTVRAPNPPQTVTKFATVAPGKTLTIDLPADFASMHTATLSVSSSPAVGVTGALDWLNRYPYGCLEQTVSAAFPFLSTASLVKSGLLDAEVADTMASKVPAAYARILPMMAGDGAFSMWPDVRKEWPEGTVYAAHFIFEAEAAKRIAVDPEVKRSISSYLLRLANSAGNYKPELRAYATYALAASGNRDFAIPARNILAGRQPGFATFLASAALIRGGFAGDGAEAFKQALSDTSWLYKTAPAVGITDTTSRAGMALDVIMKCDPKGCKAEAAELAAFLAGRIRKDGNCWGATQSNAWASMGLAAFAEHYPPAEMNGEITLSIKGSEKETFTAPTTKNVLTSEKTVVANNGAADLFVQTVVSGVPKAAQTASGPVRLKREYFDEKGNPVTSLKHGELAFVRILADAPEVIEHIVISDILPAGLEIEDDALATRMDASGRIPKNILPKDRHAFSRTEKRDDRFLVFGALYESAYAIYTVRAVTPGTFTIPALHAEDMYDPDMAGTYVPPAGQNVFEVK
ncbi:MAG: MG2 domain-containing protein [Lentisphaeria bacterium]|nr:MG2 domain-containing protein [Lentisphaeria bacterium]